MTFDEFFNLFLWLIKYHHSIRGERKNQEVRSNSLSSALKVWTGCNFREKIDKNTLFKDGERFWMMLKVLTTEFDLFN